MLFLVIHNRRRMHQPHSRSICSGNSYRRDSCSKSGPDTRRRVNRSVSSVTAIVSDVRSGSGGGPSSCWQHVITSRSNGGGETSPGASQSNHTTRTQ